MLKFFSKFKKSVLEQLLFKRYKKMLFFLFLMWGLALVNFLSFFITIYFLGFSIWIVYTYYVIHAFMISQFVYWFVIGFVSRFIRKYIKKKYYYPELERLYQTSADFNKDFFLRLFYVRPELKYVDEPVARPILNYVLDVLNDIHTFYKKFIYAFFLKFIKPHLSEDLLKDNRPKYDSYFSENLIKDTDTDDESQSIFSEVLFKQDIDPEVYQEVYQSLSEEFQTVLFWNFMFVVCSFWLFILGDNFSFAAYFEFIYIMYAMLYYVILYTIWIQSFLFFFKHYLQFRIFDVLSFLTTSYFRLRHYLHHYLRPKVESCLMTVLYYPFSFFWHVQDKIISFLKDRWLDITSCHTMLRYYFIDLYDGFVTYRAFLKSKYLDPIINHGLYQYLLLCIYICIIVVFFCAAIIILFKIL